MISLALALILSVIQEPAKDKMRDCPMHTQHDQMNARGEHAMGFSQTETTHHFLLADNGGSIQVEANSPTDKKSVEQIRMHLSHIAKMFQDGDFDIPMFVHDAIPPGVTEMKRLKSKIDYAFEETASGGRVKIATQDKVAIEAIHKFLRFQIQEHRTGDSR
jgi:hypothetical protein